ncbi:cation:proton antiporter [uncultured Mailhella sp.]|uniref:cation:proton antiporter domain-containing protein n=1 Tax=uncultured Mailhella sp. TaxID=1981031 RepID=UPI0025E01491|nr:cation:proton antiporter [uncultured Mailhella sp.]
MEDMILREIVVLFILSIIVVLVCLRFRLPSIVGFLLTGVLCGPSALGLIPSPEAVDTMADVGVAFLMFSIGMELSGKELVRLKKPLFLGGSSQVLLTMAFVFLLTFWWSGPRLGVVYGCMVTLSSTAIVLSILQQKALTESPQGQVCLAVLIFQDLAIVPMVLIFPLLAGGLELDTNSMIFAVGKGVLVIGAILLFGKYLLHRLMFSVVSTRSRELMLMTTLGLCLAVALITSWLGLSLALGAFLAGLMMAESEYSLNTLESIMPFKEVFSSIFFISVGMLLDIRFFLTHLPIISLCAAAIIIAKILMVVPAVRVLRYSMRTALLAAFSLAQVGEFSFVLAKSALGLELISNDAYQVFLASSILTMVLTPLLIGVAPKVTAKILRRPDMQTAEAATDDGSEHDDTENANGIIRDGRLLKDHLIIIGFGIGGQIMAHGAKSCGIPYIISEMNPTTVEKYRSTEPIRHGDASFPLVLEHLGASTARALAILTSDPAGSRAIIANARAMNPSLHIIVRTRFLGNLNSYKEVGANEVIPEEFETSLEVFARVLNHYLVPRQTIDQYVSAIRRENYGMQRRLGMGGSIMDSLPDLQLVAYAVEEGSPLAGKTIAEAALRKVHGVTAAGVRRGDAINNNPDAQTQLLAGDIVYLLATQEALAKAAHLFQTEGMEAA